MFAYAALIYQNYELVHYSRVDMPSYTLLRHRRRTLSIGKVIFAFPMFVVLSSVVFVLGKLGGKSSSDSNIDIEKHGSHASNETATMLKWAASSGNVEVLRNILQVASSKDKTTMASASGEALTMGIRNCHTEAAKLLIETKEGIFYQNAKGVTALHWAVRGGHSSVCQTLLLAGADQNARALAFKTPLD
jgi:hypothetical protein